MEDTVISLAEDGTDTDSYESAKEIAKKVKKKQKIEEREARKRSKEMKQTTEIRRSKCLDEKTKKILSKETETEERSQECMDVEESKNDNQHEE